MEKKFALGILLLLCFLINNVKSQEYPGFKVSGRHLYDRCGERVILRGISNPNIWFEKNGLPRYGEIFETGANVVRIVWQTYGSASDLDKAINNCVAWNMIPMIELHDATGEWSKLQQCVDYWISDDVIEVIHKHESYLLINIANECGNGSVSNTTFKNGYESAVNSMREAGIHVPLIIDGSSYGQNINILQSQGPALIEADSDHNLIFSVHMWWPKMYGFSEQSIIDEIAESVEMGLPLIVGEFSQMHGSCEEKTITDNNSIAYKTIIRECQENQVGYIAWSWFGNCNPFWDMSTDGTFETLYDWGLEVAVTDENSIKNTSIRPYSLVNGKCDPKVSADNLLYEKRKSRLKNISNPFSGSIEISYYLDEDKNIELSVFDYQGRKIRTLVNSFQYKGDHTINFDAADLPRGIYFYSIAFENCKETQKMVIVK